MSLPHLNPLRASEGLFTSLEIMLIVQGLLKKVYSSEGLSEASVGLSEAPVGFPY